MDVWEQIKQRLAITLTQESFENWFAKTRLFLCDGDQIWVSVPTESAAVYIEQEYGSLIRKTISELRLPIRQVQFEVHPVAPVASAVPELNGVGRCSPLGLNPRLTFDTFVVGPCNELAYTAAQTVAESPARTYNPLLVCGGAGMGKTHLLHALGWELHARYPATRIVFTSGERFMNEWGHSVRFHRVGAFHQTYRTADVLVIDDIHALSGKEGTQDELLRTFNDLYERDRQIVMASDCPPREIPGLNQRLRSRLESGLLVMIQPPDLETKLAILDRKAEREGIDLPEDVRILIATRVRSSVRELEAVLLRLQAVSSVSALPLTVHLAQQALRDLLPDRDRRINIESIVKAVAAHFELQPAQLKARCNARRIALPRQIAMYLARELTSASLPEIARALGGKHHTTVLHSIRKIERLRDHDQDLNRLIHRLMDALQ